MWPSLRNSVNASDPGRVAVYGLIEGLFYYTYPATDCKARAAN